jgi:hypothetical protein
VRCARSEDVLGGTLCEAHFEFRGGTRRPKYLAGACVRRLTPAFAILAIA